MREQLWRSTTTPACSPRLPATTSRRPGRSPCGGACRRPVAAQRVREATLTKLLKQHRIRRVDAATLCDRAAGAGRPGRHQVPPRPPRRACAAQARRTPRTASTGNWRTRAASSTDWLHQLAEAALGGRPGRARRELSQSRRHRRRVAAILLSTARHRHRRPRRSASPRVATRCGGGRYAALRLSRAGWRRSPGSSGKSAMLVVRRLAAARPAARRRLPTGLASLAHRDPVSRAKYQAAAQPRPSGHARSTALRWPTACSTARLRLCSATAPSLRPAPCRKCHRVNS